jgi:hypothetical protein
MVKNVLLIILNLCLGNTCDRLRTKLGGMLSGIITACYVFQPIQGEVVTHCLTLPYARKIGCNSFYVGDFTNDCSAPCF